MSKTFEQSNNRFGKKHSVSSLFAVIPCLIGLRNMLRPTHFTVKRFQSRFFPGLTSDPQPIEGCHSANSCFSALEGERLW